MSNLKDLFPRTLVVSGGKTYYVNTDCKVISDEEFEHLMAAERLVDPALLEKGYHGDLIPVKRLVHDKEGGVHLQTYHVKVEEQSKKDMLSQLKDAGVKAGLSEKDLENFHYFMNNKLKGFDLETYFKNSKQEILNALGSRNQTPSDLRMELKYYQEDKKRQDSGVLTLLIDSGMGDPDNRVFVKRSFMLSEFSDMPSESYLPVERGRMSVTHDLFKVGKNLRGTGLATKLFQIAYEQYKAANVELIQTHANITSQVPINGANYWGKFGFVVEKRQANKMVKAMQELVDNDPSDNELAQQDNPQKLVKVEFKDGKIIKPAGLDVNSDMVIRNDRDSEEWQQLVKDNPDCFYTVTKSDADRFKRVVQDYFKENPTSKFIPMNIFNGYFKKDQLRGMLQGIDWHGRIDLKNKDQREAFEAAIK